MAKHNLEELDKGQLDFMWDFLKLRKSNTCTKKDVHELKKNLDCIRQAMVQKTGGERENDPKCYINSRDVGTYTNLVVLSAMTLYIYGGLDILENALPEVAENE